MNAKDLERLLAQHGANPTSVTVVVQKLRESMKVAVGGRGFNAHDLTADEVSWILATYLGSDTPARASETLARLLKLRSADAAPKDFVPCFQFILRREIKGVREIRVARNADFAQILFNKGSPWIFTKSPSAAQPVLRSEGVISADLINVLADNVVDESQADDERVIE